MAARKSAMSKRANATATAYARLAAKAEKAGRLADSAHYQRLSQHNRKLAHRIDENDAQRRVR